MEPIKGNDKHSFKRHLRALALVRTRRIVRTIPASTPLRTARQWQHYAVVAVHQLGKRKLERVIWPWLKPIEPKCPPYMRRGRWARLERIDPAARVKRGRASNPTALQ